MALLESITDFQPYTEHESVAKKRQISLIKQYQHQILDRDCPEGHITCSGIILSPDLQKTLMAYHLL
ncbi:MAG: hypothetical protein K2O42_01970 [Oscillospiraceae bacterium]|nr:hypothetical protein [Oscillospiraceae bacterium]